MQLSVFDIFKIGVGPSSSHTMGPMIAAERFMQFLKDGDWPRPMGTDVARVQVHLHGSLAFTGKGHATDRAVMLGLCGFVPEEMDLEAAELALAEIARTHRVGHDRFGWVDFDPASDLIFDYETPVGRHANAMTLDACDAFGQRVFRETYYSVRTKPPPTE